MKKNATRATALALLLQDVLNRRLLLKQINGNSAKTIIPSFLRFWNWAEENCRCSQNFVAAQKMLLKRNPANIRKWIVRILLTQAFILRWKRVCIAHNNCMSCPYSATTHTTAH